MKHISAVMCAITEKLGPLYQFIENSVTIETDSTRGLL